MTERADQLQHKNVTAHSTALVNAFLARRHITQVCRPPYSPDSAPCDLWLLKAKITIERKEICECDGHTVHKLGQRRLTADWLAPQESDCSWMRSNFSSDWLPCYVYIKATWPVLLIFKIAGYFPDRPRVVGINCNNHLWLAAKLHQGHLTSSFDIQNSWTLSRQASYGRC